jgi:thiol-disulfide isomerase/thioredoxin
MNRRGNGICWLVAITCCMLVPASCLAEPLTAEAVLAEYRVNQARLRQLHLQVSVTQEWTQAFRDDKKHQVDQCELILQKIESGEVTADSLGAEAKAAGITLEYLTLSMRSQLESSQALADNDSIRQFVEIFIDGENYQVRTPARSTSDDQPDWTFPTAAVTAETLVSDYKDVRIYSRSIALQPPARVWCGASDAGVPNHALVMDGHLSDAEHQQLPPMTDRLHPPWDQRHPIDTFFSAPPERYRVVGEETVDGRLLTIVDALVPHPVPYSSMEADGQVKTTPRVDYYRAWLDLQRGAIPMKLKQWYGQEGMDFEATAATPPIMVLTAAEVQDLPDGGFYPSVTVREDFQQQPTTDGEEVSYAVHERLTWKCSLVETRVAQAQSFFALDFPQGQTFYDMDSKKVIGALDPSSPVRRGEPAPPLTVARWLDGKSRSLEDFRGRVVVVDFWGLWCSACRNGVPSLKEIQARYRDQPVTFIAIHTAEADADALAQRIEKYAAGEDWQFLHAIDSGTRSENSATSHAYGVAGFPTEVVIGPDGVVAFNSSIPSASLEDIVGKACDEMTPEDMKRFETYMKEQFAAAGVPYPGSDEAAGADEAELVNRVHTFMLSREIDSALEAANP